MIPAILFAVSLVAFAQFGLYYWRATIAGVAAQTVSERICIAAGIKDRAISAGDFSSILLLNKLSPDLQGPNGSFWGIRGYYAAVDLVGRAIPAMASWAQSEMTTCSRYLAVLMDQHLQRNLATAAEVRGM